MSDGPIHLTAAQAQALAAVAASDTTVAVHQLGGADGEPADVYVTAVGATAGTRIAADGTTEHVDNTLPG